MCKTCAKCGETKSLDQFGSNKRNKDGLDYRCKSCRKQDAQDRRQKAREAGTYKTSKAEENRKLRYGLSVDEYESLLQKQGGVCAICKGQCPTGWRLAVDHSHETGKVRGLLCLQCNTALGQFKDSPELLAHAIKYLQENQ